MGKRNNGLKKKGKKRKKEKWFNREKGKREKCIKRKKGRKEIS
jgi:hypothetical protein